MKKKKKKKKKTEGVPLWKSFTPLLLDDTVKGIVHQAYLIKC
jgi:hypothetical protein